MWTQTYNVLSKCLNRYIFQYSLKKKKKKKLQESGKGNQREKRESELKFGERNREKNGV